MKKDGFARIFSALFTLTVFFLTQMLTFPTADAQAPDPAVPESVRISEIMPANKAFLANGDGRFRDWIELFNASGKAICLEGYGLSDKPSGAKWVFPNEHILEKIDELTAEIADEVPRDLVRWTEHSLLNWTTLVQNMKDMIVSYDWAAHNREVITWHMSNAREFFEKNLNGQAILHRCRDPRLSFCIHQLGSE